MVKGNFRDFPAKFYYVKSKFPKIPFWPALSITGVSSSETVDWAKKLHTGKTKATSVGIPKSINLLKGYTTFLNVVYLFHPVEI